MADMSNDLCSYLRYVQSFELLYHKFYKLCKKIVKKFTFYGYYAFLLVVLRLDFVDFLTVFFSASFPGKAFVPNFL